MSVLRGQSQYKCSKFKKNQFYGGAAQHFPKVYKIENAYSKGVSSISWAIKLARIEQTLKKLQAVQAALADIL